MSSDPIEVAAFPEGDISGLFMPGEDSPFVDLDANLAAWLPETFPASEGLSIESLELTEHLDNRELIDSLGGEEAIRNAHCFSPQQFRSLAERALQDESLFLRNQYGNIFFLLNPNDDKLYLLNAAWDKDKRKFTPYIYKTKNLFRAWSRGNRLFRRAHDPAKV